MCPLILQDVPQEEGVTRGTHQVATHSIPLRAKLTVIASNPAKRPTKAQIAEWYLFVRLPAISPASRPC